MILHSQWLLLFVTVFTVISQIEPKELRVVCYYTNWSVYRPGSAKFNPQNINPYLCTHLIYAFGGFTKENTLKPFDKYQDIEKGGYAKFTGLKTYNKQLKTMLAIGGWNEGSTRFSPMVASADRRKELVRNVVKFLRQNHFDGLDLDWEYPSFRDGGKTRDRDNYANLVQELREEFDRESQKTGRPRLLLTMAVPAGIEYINKGYDVPKLMKYLDWMNILSYDYHSAFEPSVNHHAPLFPLEEESEYNYDTELNIDHTIKHYMEAGAIGNKLVLGIPTYGRSYTLFNPDANEIGDPADGPGEMGDATRENGYLAYYEICESVKSDEWTVVQPNEDAMGPYAFRDNQWVGYDDEAIVRKKAKYVADNGLGGIMFWAIDNDDFRGTCHNKSFPIIEAAKEALIDSLGLVDENSIKKNTIGKKQQATRRPSGNSRRRLNNRRTTTSTTTTTTTTEATKATRRRRPTKKKTRISNDVVEPEYKESGSSLVVTPNWKTPEPPTTPDPGGDFKCEDEGFYPHPRDCKKYFWCLNGPSDLGIIAHQFNCPAGLYFNKAASSCDYTQNVLCNKKIQKAATTSTPYTKEAKTTSTTEYKSLFTTPRVPPKITAATSRTTYQSTTAEPEYEDEYEYEDDVEDANNDSEDPALIKELLDLIKKAGGVEQLEKQFKFKDSPQTSSSSGSTTPSSISKKLYERVLSRTKLIEASSERNKFQTTNRNSRGPQYKEVEGDSEKKTVKSNSRLQYSTISRKRPSKPEPEDDDEDEDEEVEEEENEKVVKAKKEDKPKYVTLRRNRPSTTESTVAEEDEIEEDNNKTNQKRNRFSTTSSSVDSNSGKFIRRGRTSTTETPEDEEEDEEKPEEEVVRKRPTTTTRSPYVTLKRSRPTTEAISKAEENEAKEDDSGDFNRKFLGENQEDKEDNDAKGSPNYITLRRNRPKFGESATTKKTLEENQNDEDENKEKGSQPEYTTLRRTRPKFGESTTAKKSLDDDQIDDDDDNSPNYSTLRKNRPNFDESTTANSRYKEIQRGTTQTASTESVIVSTNPPEPEAPQTESNNIFKDETNIDLTTPQSPVGEFISITTSKLEITPPQLLEPRPFSINTNVISTTVKSPSTTSATTTFSTTSTTTTTTTTTAAPPSTTQTVTTASKVSYKPLLRTRPVAAQKPSLPINNNTNDTARQTIKSRTESRGFSRFRRPESAASKQPEETGRLRTTASSDVEESSSSPESRGYNRFRTRPETTTRQQDIPERHFRPEDAAAFADLSSLTAVDFSSIKDFSGGARRSRTRLTTAASSTTITTATEETIKTGPRTLTVARKYLESSLPATNKRRVIKKVPEPEPEENVKVEERPKPAFNARPNFKSPRLFTRPTITTTTAKSEEISETPVRKTSNDNLFKPKRTKLFGGNNFSKINTESSKPSIDEDTPKPVAPLRKTINDNLFKPKRNKLFESKFPKVNNESTEEPKKSIEETPETEAPKVNDFPQVSIETTESPKVEIEDETPKTDSPVTETLNEDFLEAKQSENNLAEETTFSIKDDSTIETESPLKTTIFNDDQLNENDSNLFDNVVTDKNLDYSTKSLIEETPVTEVPLTKDTNEPNLSEDTFTTITAEPVTTTTTTTEHPTSPIQEQTEGVTIRKLSFKTKPISIKDAHLNNTGTKSVSTTIEDENSLEQNENDLTTTENAKRLKEQSTTPRRFIKIINVKSRSNLEDNDEPRKIEVNFRPTNRRVIKRLRLASPHLPGDASRRLIYSTPIPYLSPITEYEEIVENKAYEEEDENIKLSESNILENSDVSRVNSNSIKADGEKGYTKVIKRIRPGFKPQNRFEDRKTTTTTTTTTTTEPNIVVRTRKIIRKLSTTTAYAPTISEVTTSARPLLYKLAESDDALANRKRKIIRRLRPYTLFEGRSSTTEKVVEESDVDDVDEVTTVNSQNTNDEIDDTTNVSSTLELTTIAVNKYTLEAASTQTSDVTEETTARNEITSTEGNYYTTDEEASTERQFETTYSYDDDDDSNDVESTTELLPYETTEYAGETTTDFDFTTVPEPTEPRPTYVNKIFKKAQNRPKLNLNLKQLQKSNSLASSTESSLSRPKSRFESYSRRPVGGRFKPLANQGKPEETHDVGHGTIKPFKKTFRTSPKVFSRRKPIKNTFTPRYQTTTEEVNEDDYSTEYDYSEEDDEEERVDDDDDDEEEVVDDDENKEEVLNVVAPVIRTTETAKTRKANVPYDTSTQHTTKAYKRFTSTTPLSVTQDLGDINLDALNERNKKLFKTRKMNVPHPGTTEAKELDTTPGSTASATESALTTDEILETTSEMDVKTTIEFDATTAGSDTTITDDTTMTTMGTEKIITELEATTNVETEKPIIELDMTTVSTETPELETTTMEVKEPTTEMETTTIGVEKPTTEMETTTVGVEKPTTEMETTTVKTEKPTTLHHIFAQTESLQTTTATPEPVEELGTEEEPKSVKLERLIEINRIVEINGEKVNERDHLGVVNRVTEIKVVDGNNTEVRKTKIIIDGPNILTEILNSNRQDRKYEFNLKTNVDEQSVDVIPNQISIEGKSNVRTITPRPLFSNEVSTISLEGLFRTNSPSTAAYEEILDADHSRIVNVRYPAMFIPIPEGDVAMRAKIVEIKPSEADLIKIAPIAVSLSKKN
ncbi:PREDICTED: serine-rich adhesin for platelets-like isoform X2 [Nicrophorus vespilloides]|uniref:Serine-rich adhesin for platelets-like isoform X2 n=1 Tax=Nicrophorus vespilloides TaxID=110193 RepID=A0ABM1N024_NICVS|nr:PREDICTED: serine-rich adhesin for platelets-like isoform X2 [Nicrophorus vespilloides]